MHIKTLLCCSRGHNSNKQQAHQSKFYNKLRKNNVDQCSKFTLMVFLLLGHKRTVLNYILQTRSFATKPNPWLSLHDLALLPHATCTSWHQEWKPLCFLCSLHSIKIWYKHATVLATFYQNYHSVAKWKSIQILIIKCWKNVKDKDTSRIPYACSLHQCFSKYRSRPNHWILCTRSLHKMSRSLEMSFFNQQLKK